MSNTLRLGIPSTKIKLNCRRSFAYRCSSIVRLPERRVASLRLQSVIASYDPSESSRFTSTVGSSPALLWNFTQRHIILLNVISCVVAVSATWLFCSAIPTLLAFKRAAESLEKLLDVTREELPGTMAAARLSGMEISDLTMELSDLGQQITHGVRGSTRAIRFAEERMRLLTNTSPTVPMQEVSTLETKNPGPMVAKTARGMKEAVVKGRSVLQIFFTLMKFSKMALNYFASRAKS